jgi:hypothetical protein
MPESDAMLTYRTHDESVDPRIGLAGCLDRARRLADKARPDHGTAVGLLIDFGELEAGIADSLFPDRDGQSAQAETWRRAALAVGHLVRCTARADAGAQSAAEAAKRHLERLSHTPLPAHVRRRVSEGYAWYALYPETYLEAAEAFHRANQPGAVVCIGIRSIGTSLSAMVGAALEGQGCAVRMLSLRPHGHPFDRRPVLTPELADSLRRDTDAHFLLIDEGPGLSGSSLCGTAALLSELGIPDHRIALFPSWLPDANGFVSETARRRWPRHAKWHRGFEAFRLTRGRLGNDAEDLSGGLWRRQIFDREADYPAIHPWHERRKYRTPDGMLWKFAGLGRYGDARLARAHQLADAGFTPQVTGLYDGFLVQPFVPGRPCRPGAASADLLDTAARYMAYLHRHCVTGGPVRFDELAGMIEVNIRESLGEEEAVRLAGLECWRARLADVPAVATDGRMMPHEWLRTPTGLLKTDALDHHDDHFFPGPTDIAWDVAGFAVEFGLGRPVTDRLAADVAARAGDATLPERLPFFELAYLAFRVGYTMTAAMALGETHDGLRMRSCVQFHRRRLQAALPHFP